MSHDALLSVLGRAAIEPAFLEKLKADPEAAAKEAGVTLSPDQLTQLKQVDFDGLTTFSKQVAAKKLAAVVDKKDG